MSRRLLPLLPILLAVPGLFLFGGEAEAPKKYALVIGVNKYRHAEMNRPEPLRYAEADATEMAAFLKTVGYDVDVLTGSDATAAAIRAKVEKLRTRGNSDGVVLVALAGHGVQLEGDEDAYFCPYDVGIREAVRNGRAVVDRAGDPILEPDPAGCVKLADIVKEFRLAPAGTRVLMADCCRNDPATGRGRGVGTDLKINQIPNTAVLLSCGTGQRSWEDARWKHGAFFYHVLEGLKAGKSDAFELTVYLRKAVATDVSGLPTAPTQTPHPILNGTRLDLGLVVPRSPIPQVPVPPSLPPQPREFVSKSTGMKFVRIPAGTFTMGSPAGEADRDDDETQHEVELTKDFYLGVTEVTQKQWTAVMGTTPWSEKGYVKEGEEYPATYVSWEDAVEFAKKLSTKDGVEYRLPTEAEWEYACRAGSKSAYSFGGDAKSLGDHAWYDANARDKGEIYAHRVGEKKANSFGLYDMHGNVGEWCSDWKGDYPEARVTDPTGPEHGSFRVFRGGSWNDSAWFGRSAYRDGYAPPARDDSLGFRLALVPSGQ